jgi:hypothetical protein
MKERKEEEEVLRLNSQFAKRQRPGRQGCSAAKTERR